MEDIISLKQQGEIPYIASTDIVWGSFERIRQRMRKKKTRQDGIYRSVLDCSIHLARKDQQKYMLSQNLAWLQ